MGKLTNWIKTHIVLTCVIVFVVIYCFKAAIDFTSNPIFCKGLCHDMAPDVDSYRASFHGSGNNGKPLKHHGHKSDCHGCHYIPGVVGLIKGKIAAVLVSVPHEITGNRGEPFSELPEEEQKEILPQYIHAPTTTFFVKSKGEKFICPPAKESRWIINEQCKRCHPDMSKMVKVNALLDVQKDISADTAKVSKKKLQPVNADKFSAVSASHPSHEDRGLICLDCHQEIAHAPVDLGISPLNLPRMEICFHCHNEKEAFRDACEKCHVGQVMMHAGIGAKDVSETPGLMKETGCTECGHDEGNKYKADIATCDGCHEKGYKDMVADWRASYEAALKPVDELLKELEKSLKKVAKKSSSDLDKARKLYSDAKYNYDFATKDASKGGHNSDYTDAMLKKSKEKLEEAKKLIKL